MGTPVNDSLNPVTFVLGKENAIDLQFTAEQSWQLLREVIALMKPQWRELAFINGIEHQTQQLTLWSLPDELLKIRFMRVYGGQQYQRDDTSGYVIYCITPGRKWLRVFESSVNGSAVYQSHQWLTQDDMMAVMTEDPSLLRYLISGLKHQTERAADSLRKRAEKLDKLDGKLEFVLHLFGILNQPWPRDLPSSTLRLPM